MSKKQISFTYTAARGAHLSDKQAERYGQRITELLEAHGGQITPTEILTDAKRKRSPLHEFFEWDDDQAAQQYRIDQARYLLRMIQITIRSPEREPEELRAYHNVVAQTSNGAERVYVGLARVLNEKPLRAQLLASALRQAEEWHHRWRQYKDIELVELMPVFMAIDEARDVVSV